MPVKLIPPKAGRTPNYRARGTHLDGSRFATYVDESLGTGDKRKAQGLLVVVVARIELEIKRRGDAGQEPPAKPSDFGAAATSYMNAGGEARFLPPLIRWFKDAPLPGIDQGAIDAAAAGLYPDAPSTTRNRQVYSPMSAVLKHAGFDRTIKRPKGWRGQSRLHWLEPEQAFAFIDAALDLDIRFGAMVTALLYCGPRLSEVLRIEWPDMRLAQSFAYLRKTKNGHPQPVYLPPPVVGAIGALPRVTTVPARGRRPERIVQHVRVFDGLTKCGRLYELHDEAARRAGVVIPAGIAFHIWRHTYGAWARRFGDADTSDLVATGRWLSRESAALYEHVDIPDAARVADTFPTRAEPVQNLLIVRNQ